MMSKPGNNNFPPWKWAPTKAELATFVEWKGILIGQLVSCRKGLNPTRINAMLKEQTGENIPFQKMGLKVPNIYQFLYQMRNDITLRRVDGRLFVFIEERAVPSEMAHIREMVLHQNRSKTDKPLKHHGEYAPSIDLVKYTPRPPPQVQSTSGSGYSYGRPSNPAGSFLSSARRPGGAWGGGATTTTVRKVSNLNDWGAPSHRPPMISTPRRPVCGGPVRRPYLPGLLDEDESDSDDDRFDFYSGVTASTKSTLDVKKEIDLDWEGEASKNQLVKPTTSSSVTPKPRASVANPSPIPGAVAKPPEVISQPDMAPGMGKVDQMALAFLPGQGRRFRTFSMLTGRFERVTPSSESPEGGNKSPVVVATPQVEPEPHLDPPRNIDQVALEFLPGQGRRFRTFSKLTGRLEHVGSPSSGFQAAGSSVGPTSSAGKGGRPPFKFPVYVLEDAPETCKGYLNHLDGLLMKYRALLDKVDSSKKGE